MKFAVQTAYFHLVEVKEENFGGALARRSPLWTTDLGERKLFDDRDEAQAVIDEFSETNTTMRDAFIVSVRTEAEVEVCVDVDADE